MSDNLYEGEFLISPAVLFVYKTTIKPNLGKMSFFKVISGVINTGDELIKRKTGDHERINQLFIVDGQKDTRYIN